MGTHQIFKRIFFGAFLVVTLCLLLFVFNTTMQEKEEVSEEEEIYITLVYAFQNSVWNQSIRMVAQRFEEKYPNIKLNLHVQYEENVYEDILYKLQARNQMGDIIQLKAPIRYAKEGLLASIPLEIADTIRIKANYEDTCVALGAIESVSGIIYNQEIFTRLGLSEPKDYGEFLALCEKLKAKGITPIGVAGGNLWHLEFWMNHFFHSEILLKEPDFLYLINIGKEKWNGELGIQFLSKIKELFDQGYINSDWKYLGEDGLLLSMAKGNIAMMYTGGWSGRSLLEINPDIELGWFFVPSDTGNYVATSNQDVYWSILKEVEEDEKKYQAVCTFLTFFYSEEVYPEVCEALSGYATTDAPIEILRSTFEKEVEEKFLDAEYVFDTYIGNEDTPEHFEKQLLFYIIDMVDATMSVEETADKLDILWQQLQSDVSE